MKLSRIGGWIIGLLREIERRAVLLPADPRGQEQVDVNTVFGRIVGTDAIVGGQLRERAGAAGPFIFVIDFFRGMAVVVGIIETSAVGLNRFRAGDGVVQHLFHAVPVTRVLRQAKQISGYLELTVRAARGLETGARFFQACGKQPFAWDDERLVGSPASGGIALFLDHSKTVGGSAEVFLVSQHEIGLHGRT